MTLNKKIIGNLIRTVALGLFITLSIGVKANAMTIVLDPGHGGPGTSGAGAYYPPYMEKALNLAVASQVKSELEAAGIKVYMTRSGDVSLDLAQRAAYAKSVNADVLISIHFNSSGTHASYGTEAWTSLYGSYYTTGYALGSSIQKQLAGLGFVAKGVKTKMGNSGDYYGIIRNSVAVSVPAIIVEHCFMDNAIDRAIMESVGISGLAHADATGIINYVNSVGGPGASLLKADPVVFAEGATALGGGTTSTSAVSSTSNTLSPVTFPKDASGNIIYTDPNGNTGTFTQAEWDKLLANWSYTGNPTYYIRQVPIADLNAMAGK